MKRFDRAYRWALISAFLLALLLACALDGHAQTLTYPYGTIKDLTGTAVSSGKVTFDLRPGADATISGVTRFTPQTVTCRINANGNIVILATTNDRTVSSIARAANVVTVTTTANHPYATGDYIVISGVTGGTTAFNGLFQITSTGAATFTYPQTGANEAGAAGTTHAGCRVTQNTSLVPTGSYYLVTNYPGNVPTAKYNWYARTTTEDLTTVVPTPATAPGYTFVDMITNQTIGGDKTFTGSTTFNQTVVLGGATPFSVTGFPLVSGLTVEQIDPTFTIRTANNYNVTAANPGAARAITISDPGGADEFLWKAASQAITNKTFNSTNTYSGVIDNAATFTGYNDRTAIAAPSTPAAGKARVYIDNVSKKLCSKDDAGAVTCTSGAAASSWAYNATDKAWELFDSTITGALLSKVPGFEMRWQFGSGSLNTTDGGYHGGGFAFNVTGIVAACSPVASTGKMRMTTGATSGNGCALTGWRQATNGHDFFQLQNVQTIYFTIDPVQTTSVTLRVGISGAGSTSPPTQSVYLEHLSTDTNWFLVTCTSPCSGGTQTRTDTTVALAPGAQSFIMTIATGTVSVYQPGNSTAKATNTTNIPAASQVMGFFGQVVTAAAAAKSFDFYAAHVIGKQIGF